MRNNKKENAQIHPVMVRLSTYMSEAAGRDAAGETSSEKPSTTSSTRSRR